jgi:magnesium-transporting ATPase (P-type)
MTEKMIRKNIQSELEKDLTLIGVTAMEDLLQDSVE